MAARVSDWYFMNGNTPEGVQAQIEEVSGYARAAGRAPGTDIRFGLNAFIVARETEAEARETVAEIIDKADARRSKASATRSNRPASRPATSAACGRTRSSRTWSSTTTASAPA